MGVGIGVGVGVLDQSTHDIYSDNYKYVREHLPVVLLLLLRYHLKRHRRP